MSEEVSNREEAAAIAREYADEEDRCIGEFGEITDIQREDGVWVVEFRTHTLSDEYRHRIRITSSVGNVISHDRETKF